MKFGVREVCNVIFKAKSDIVIGSRTFKKGQPVLYIDTAKMSTLEQATSTVYATGGQGNSRLLAWEGDKTLTFTVEDALLTPVGFSMLSGAGLFGQSSDKPTTAHVHKVTTTTISSHSVDLSNDLLTNEAVDAEAPFFIIQEETGEKVPAESDFSVEDNVITGLSEEVENGTAVWVDYYVTNDLANIDEMQIDTSHFARSYYVEAETSFRRQRDGLDMPVILTFPNVKIQSNFTFTMASSGDPSTFTFTMDAFPGYTAFDNTKKVLCVMQILPPRKTTLKTIFMWVTNVDEEDEQDYVITTVSSASTVKVETIPSAVSATETQIVKITNSEVISDENGDTLTIDIKTYSY